MATKQLGLSLCARQNAATCATSVNCFNVVFTDHTAFDFTLRDREQAQKQTRDSEHTLNVRSVYAEQRLGNATVVHKT